MKKFLHILLHGWYDDDFMRGLYHSGCFTTILFILIGIPEPEDVPTSPQGLGTAPAPEYERIEDYWVLPF